MFGRVAWVSHGGIKGAFMALPRGVNRLVWSNLAAQSAEQVALAATPIVAATVLGAGPAATGLLAAAQTIPFLLLSLPAGLLADRFARRRLMAGAEAIRAAALLALLVLVAAGGLSLVGLAAIGCLAATGTVVYSVAAPALVPALAPRAALAAVNGRLELARSAAFTAGPALGGALVAWTGAGSAFALAAGMSVAACALLAGLPEPARGAGPGRRLGRDLREGAAFAWRQPLLRAILLVAIVWNFSWFVLQAVFVLFALQHLRMDTAAIGAALGLYGLGMVVGAAVTPRIARRVTFGTLLVIGPVVSVLGALLLAATIVRPVPGLAFAAMALFGAGPIVWTISQTTLRQAVTPDALLGRVSAVMLMATYGARPLGALLGGAVGARFGVEAALGVMAAGFAVQAAIVMLSPLARLVVLPGGARG